MGIKSVQEAASAMDFYNAAEGWVVSTAQYCTKPAKALAAKRGIKLYCKNDLAIMLDGLLSNGQLTVDK